MFIQLKGMHGASKTVFNVVRFLVQNFIVLAQANKTYFMYWKTLKSIVNGFCMFLLLVDKIEFVSYNIFYR